MNAQTFVETRQQSLIKELARVDHVRTATIERLLAEPQHTEPCCWCLDRLHAETLRILSDLADLAVQA